MDVDYRLARAALMGELTPIDGMPGTSRYVYLHNGIVYKVERNEDSLNRDEFHNLYRLSHSTLPAGIRIPKAEIFYFEGGVSVIAMEYIKGRQVGECFCFTEDCDAECLPDNICDAIRSLGIRDIAYGNVIANDEGYWIVDAEC